MDNWQQLSELYKNLPDTLKTLLDSEQIGEVVEEISNANNLTDQQRSGLLILVSDIILGVKPYASLEIEVQTALGVNGDVAKNISGALRSKLLDQHKNELSERSSRPVESTSGASQKSDIQPLSKEQVVEKFSIPQEKVVGSGSELPRQSETQSIPLIKSNPPAEETPTEKPLYRRPQLDTPGRPTPPQNRERLER